MKYSFYILLVATDYMLPCFSKQLFGIDCPGCGLQRSIVFLFQGEFLEALKMYPAIYTLLPLLGIVVANKVFGFKRANTSITAFGIASVILILINFIFKLSH
ncbi:DUF2752 domain-containing protein [Croceitalea sp. MTPC5]|uniref:DUF2752 domain-containing protein n=1 Tax=Croceitalea sp. MTPC5 TaxID=3056565 RepID=UPI002B3933B0|nr:DUF2752 domain-containing protein [Croceitalea sp. MTPC5]